VGRIKAANQDVKKTKKVKNKTEFVSVCMHVIKQLWPLGSEGLFGIGMNMGYII